MKFIRSLLVGVVALSPLSSFSQPTQVFVVRHAERAPEPQDDPAISSEGVARAEALATVLAATNLKAIFTTQYRRTQQTATPTAKRFGLTPTVVTIKPGETDSHIKSLLAEIRRASGSVLIVGHSNTVAGIVAGLSSSNPKIGRAHV